MNILFAADMSFNYMSACPDEETIKCSMAEVAEKFAEADYSIVNLENILGNKEDYNPIIKSGPNLISSDEFMRYVKALNPTVVGLANNHTGDYGEGAIYHTMNLLEQNGYPYIGAGSNIEEAYKPYIVERDGVKVGIIAVCENEFGTAGVNKAGSAGYSLGRLTSELKKLEENNCKSIVYFHGGNETNPLPSPGKKELYRHFIDMGASAVVAMHTHCPQGWEIYNGKPIIYSMGNFFFPHAKKCLKSWYYGYMVRLTFRENEVSPVILPYCFDSVGVTLLKGEELAAFEQYLAYISGIIADDSLLGQYFDAWCSKYGHDYARGICFEDALIKGHSQEVRGMRNKFSCEAHAELLKGFMNLCYEDRMEEAKVRLEEIENLQQLRLNA